VPLPGLLLSYNTTIRGSATIGSRAARSGDVSLKFDADSDHGERQRD